jgi:glutamate dehydrogenase (NAD(P)+)
MEREHHGRGPEILELNSVPGFVVFDLPGARPSAGGTRLAPDIRVAEVALLARAMTYKFAALGERVGGAKAGVRGDPSDRTGKAALMARFCAEVGPLSQAGEFLTGPDMGTAEEDFAPLREHRASPAAIGAVVDGVPFEDVLTGFGVAVAAEAALRDGSGPGWAGRSVAIEGFGKVGGGVAREVTRRGGRVVAVSTLAGCVADPSGLDVGRLLALRHDHGDECVARYGRPVGPPGQLFTAVNADVVVPGTRPGSISARTAASLPPAVRVIAPAANAAYTAEAGAVLRERSIVALPDFVCNAGAVIGYRSAPDARPDEVLADVETQIAGLIGEALDHRDGPLAGACERAAAFLRGWWGEPPAPPFAPLGPRAQQNLAERSPLRPPEGRHAAPPGPRRARSGRTIERHRVRSAGTSGSGSAGGRGAKLAEFLVGDHAQRERYDVVKERLLAECRTRQVEPPTVDQLDRYVRSAMFHGTRLLVGRITGRLTEQGIARIRVLPDTCDDGDDDDPDLLRMIMAAPGPSGRPCLPAHGADHLPGLLHHCRAGLIWLLEVLQFRS